MAEASEDNVLTWLKAEGICNKCPVQQEKEEIVKIAISDGILTFILAGVGCAVEIIFRKLNGEHPIPLNTKMTLTIVDMTLIITLVHRFFNSTEKLFITLKNSETYNSFCRLLNRKNK